MEELRRIEFKRCRANCGTKLPNIYGVPDVCDSCRSRRTVKDGELVITGTIKHLKATNIEYVGLFAAVVTDYEEVEQPIIKQRVYETWIDSTTGKTMGRTHLA